MASSGNRSYIGRAMQAYPWICMILKEILIVCHFTYVLFHVHIINPLKPLACILFNLVRLVGFM